MRGDDNQNTLDQDLQYLISFYQKGNFFAVKQLLLKNANPNQLVHGVALLDLARDKNLKNLLIQYGAKGTQSNLAHPDNIKNNPPILIKSRKKDPSPQETSKKSVLPPSYDHQACEPLTETQEVLPLHSAVAAGDFEKVQNLIKHQIDVNAQNTNLKTALHLAAYLGHQEISKILIGQGAKVNATDKNGCTPLHYSVFGERPALTAYLLAWGANVSLADKSHHTAYDYALATKNEELTRLFLTANLVAAMNLGDLDKVESLLAMGANPGAIVDLQGNTPLHVGLYALLKHAITPELENLQKFSAMIKCLLTAGAYPKQKNRQGLSVLDLMTNIQLTFAYKDELLRLFQDQPRTDSPRPAKRIKITKKTPHDTSLSFYPGTHTSTGSEPEKKLGR